LNHEFRPGTDSAQGTPEVVNVTFNVPAHSVQQRGMCRPEHREGVMLIFFPERRNRESVTATPAEIDHSIEGKRQLK